MPGKYFEQLEVDMVFEHLPHRTVTETDNFLFTAMTHNPQPLHIDAEFAKSTQHGQIIVNSFFTLGLVVGLSIGDTTLGTTIGNLGMDRTEFPNPVFIGDTIHTKVTNKETKDDPKRPQYGQVIEACEIINQNDKVVCYSEHILLVERKK